MNEEQKRKLLQLVAQNELAYATYSIACERMFVAALAGNERDRVEELRRKNNFWEARVKARGELLAFLETVCA